MAKRIRSTSTQAGPSSKKLRTAPTTSTFATADNAAAVDANPPLLTLLKAVRDAVDVPGKGDAVVYWMRMADTRIEDNRALSLASAQALKNRVPLIALFIISPQDYIAHDRSPRKIDFTLRNLVKVKESLAVLHIPLYTVTHTPRRTLPDRVITLLQMFNAKYIFGNIEYEVDELRRDIKICELARPLGIKPVFRHDKSVIQPGVVTTKEGKTYTVYSPFQKKWSVKVNDRIADFLSPSSLPQPNAESIYDSKLYGPLFQKPVPDSVPGFELDSAEKAKMEDLWPAGASAANDILTRFLTTKSQSSQLGDASPLDHTASTTSESRIFCYSDSRDKGDSDTTSRLSPYLSAGVISVRECVRRAMDIRGVPDDAGKVRNNGGSGRWVMELAWRDFYIGVLTGFPRVSMGRPFNEKYASVVWEEDGAMLRKWQEGKTGYPIVDAAMRQLNTMGWMHNRMRMITAMFLCKDLMIDWRLGEKYFMQNLIDGDLASNNGGWQWSASTGTDSAPYFRVFNPYLQSTKGDPSGDYIRHFVPELKGLKGNELHNPPAAVADKLGYPRPCVVHADVRDRALRRYKNPGDI